MFSVKTEEIVLPINRRDGGNDKISNQEVKDGASLPYAIITGA